MVAVQHRTGWSGRASDGAAGGRVDGYSGGGEVVVIGARIAVGQVLYSALMLDGGGDLGDGVRDDVEGVLRAGTDD
jgi:hypothetical protein